MTNSDGFSTYTDEFLEENRKFDRGLSRKKISIRSNCSGNPFIITSMMMVVLQEYLKVNHYQAL